MILPRPVGDDAVRHALPAELMHELRTPLTHIIGYSEMLVEQARDAGHEQYVQDLRKVNAAGLKLLALLDQHFQAVRSAGAPGPAAPPAPVPTSAT